MVLNTEGHNVDVLKGARGNLKSYPCPECLLRWAPFHSLTLLLTRRKSRGRSQNVFQKMPCFSWWLGRQSYSTHLGRHLLNSAAEWASGGGHFLFTNYWASWWSDHLSSGWCQTLWLSSVGLGHPADPVSQKQSRVCSNPFPFLSSQGDLQRSLIQVDFGDGIAVSYANLSSTEDGIKHFYQNVGIFRVIVLVENSLGSDTAVLYLHVTCMYVHAPC